jgi:cell division protein FtsB
MKKIVLTAAIALIAFAAAAPSSQAYESRRRDEVRKHRDDRESEYRQLRAELYQLDILFSRVDSRLHYGIGRQGHWQYSRLLRDRERLNYELQRRPLDRLRVHAQIDRLRDELREIEVRLRFSHRRGW